MNSSWDQCETNTKFIITCRKLNRTDCSDINREHSIHVMFRWRARNESCFQLIPAELIAVRGTVDDVKTDSSRDSFNLTMFERRTNVAWCFELKPAEIETVTETVDDVKQTAAEIPSIWPCSKEEQIWCFELIPAELESVEESVYDVKKDSSKIFLRQTMFEWR